MRNLLKPPVNSYRLKTEAVLSYFGSFGDAKSGAFMVPSATGALKVIASASGGWDHVSVSTPARCPTWEEMSRIKDLFFEEFEPVMQLHPAKENYVNNHPYTLHLWRPQNETIPLPPAVFV